MTARGKRSISVDLKRPEAGDVIKAMAKQADVVIEPFRTGETDVLFT